MYRRSRTRLFDLGTLYWKPNHADLFDQMSIFKSGEARIRSVCAAVTRAQQMTVVHFYPVPVRD